MTPATTRLVRKYVTIAIAILIIGLLIYYILPVATPILTALVAALFLTPAVNGLTRYTKMTRPISVFVVFVSFITVISALGYILFTRALTQLNQFLNNLPSMINDVNIAWINILDNLRLQFDQYSQDIVNEIDFAVTNALIGLRDQIQDINIIEMTTSLLTAIPSYIVSFLVFLIALYLFLLDLPRLKLKVFTYFSDETAEKVSFMSNRLSYVIFGFFKAQFLVSIIIFIVTIIGLMIIAPEVALIMSIFIWAIDFIPIIGSIAVLAPWAGYQLIMGETFMAIQLLVLAGILLTIRRTVEPKVMGHHIGLSPLATLISLYIGLMLLGAIGFILGPLAVILFQSAKEADIIKFNFKI
ncbi:sporulation integral membrane protein YtvI [Salisediminibacterium beveridgei]|uniref:Sporulation integral membrane protein YtvI n=1 Tax=Salisediminibacterium beveridgei TaxID=632773 RepID=A0A1D7QWB7_9BACI|nr:sporulation integral membrane protein YtvI [Salisediminibacterium beveridgei]AOM83296.1 hypothetical protein BBEV_1935 [Salisediminibacterium beveridgei]